MFIAQIAFAQALHDRVGLDAAVVHRDARAAHQVAVAALVEDFSQLAPQHGDGAAVAVGRVDAGTANLQDRPLQVQQAMQAELFFAIEPAQGAGRLVIQQPGGGNQSPGVQVPYANVAAVNIIVIHVQAQLRTFQLGIELAAENGETQGLGFLQGLGADQAFGLQTAFIAGVTDAGDLSHGESPGAGQGCGQSTLLCKVRLCTPGVISMNLR